ncbi:MAG: hypothetical protein ACREQ9_20570 [Candidatus Binatia bacterium]
MISPLSRRWLRIALLVTIGALYVVSIPWYRDTGAPLRLWLGIPDWVAVAIGSYVLAACLNALAWLLTDVPDVEEPEGGSR